MLWHLREVFSYLCDPSNCDSSYWNSEHRREAREISDSNGVAVL